MRDGMVRLTKVCFFCFAFLLMSVETFCSTRHVIIEFLYHDPRNDPLWEPGCLPCLEEFNKFFEKNETLKRIQNNYTGQVTVNWIDYYSSDGQNRRMLYNISYANSIIIKLDEENFTVIEGDFNETYIRAVIDAYLEGTPPPSPPPSPHLIIVLSLAFSFGFFETFSPCLIMLLSFVLSYTMGKTSQSKEKFLQVIAFATGFISATVLILLALITGLVILSAMQTLHSILMLILSVLAIFFGLNLLGFKVPNFTPIKINTKPTIQKMSKKYSLTYAGLIVLGFIFYFLDPCVAPIFAGLMTTFEPSIFFNNLPLIIFAFSIGAAIPFIGIGILAGSISKLTRAAYRHRSKIRALSGLILISYAVYLIFAYYLL